MLVLGCRSLNILKLESFLRRCIVFCVVCVTRDGGQYVQRKMEKGLFLNVKWQNLWL